MTDQRVRDELEHVLPWGWALDDAKPIFGSHWQIELVEMRGDRNVRLSVTAASVAAALESARACGSLSRLVDTLPGQATVEIYVGSGSAPALRSPRGMRRAPRRLAPPGCRLTWSA